jgi:hypothetical protein
MKSMHPMSLPLLAIGYSLPQKERGSSRNITLYALPIALRSANFVAG